MYFRKMGRDSAVETEESSDWAEREKTKRWLGLGCRI